jgi:hypothetical protein
VVNADRRIPALGPSGSDGIYSTHDSYFSWFKKSNFCTVNST